MTSLFLAEDGDQVAAQFMRQYALFCRRGEVAHVLGCADSGLLGRQHVTPKALSQVVGRVFALSAHARALRRLL